MPGLSIRISPKGKATWAFRTRLPAGGFTRTTLGTHAEMNVAAARDAARGVHASIKTGGRSAAAKGARTASQVAVPLPVPKVDATREAASLEPYGPAGTLASLLAQYERCGHAPATWLNNDGGRRRVLRCFQPLLIKQVMALNSAVIVLAIDEYARPDCLSVPVSSSGADEVLPTGTRGHAEGALRAMRPAFAWAAERGYAPPDLCRVRVRSGVRRRDRVLLDSELRRIIPALLQGNVQAQMMLFLLYTITRRSEAEGATWAEIDMKAATWTIPSNRQKDTTGIGRRDFTIRLSGGAMNVLKRVRPMADPVATQLVFTGPKGGKLGNWDRFQKALFKKTGTAEWHRHDLRRTGATIMGSNGVPPHIVDAALDHVDIQSRNAGTYNRSRYSNEVVEAFRILGEKIDRLSSGVSPDRVRLVVPDPRTGEIKAVIV